MSKLKSSLNRWNSECSTCKLDALKSEASEALKAGEPKYKLSSVLVSRIKDDLCSAVLEAVIAKLSGEHREKYNSGFTVKNSHQFFVIFSAMSHC